MSGDTEPLADGAFLRFLLPSPKPAPDTRPAPSAPPARLAPPHRLFASPPPPLPHPHPDERLFIVPPTRPSWYPPPDPPTPIPPPRRAPPTTRTDPGRARNAGGFGTGRGAPVRRRVGDFVGNRPRAGPERRNAGGGLAVAKTNRGDGEARAGARRTAARTEKRVWVPVGKKGGNGGSDVDDQAAGGGGYAGGDEAEGSLEGDEQLEPDDSEQDSDLLGEELENSLIIAGGDHEYPDDDGGEEPNENLVSQSNPLQRLRVKMRGGWVECRHDINAFAPDLLSIYESLKPSEEHKSKQSQLIDSLTKSVSKEWPNAQLHLYGSCANSFGTSHSDVDVCLEIDIGTGSVVELLLRLAEILRTDNFDDVEAITSARVPIVRMFDAGSGFSCDICINNLFAVANTKLLKDYAQIDSRLLQLASIVKHWAKLRAVNETYRGTLSSYAYVLMCISFLQLREPKILPCLQAMEPTYTMVVDDTECAYFDEVHQLHDFGAENRESITELLWAFFHYWAFQHDYRKDVISIRMGKIISKKEKNWTTRVGNDRHLMCIEDPFETGHDLGRVVDRQTIRIIREEFERAAAVLQHSDDPCATLFEPYNHEPESSKIP